MSNSDNEQPTVNTDFGTVLSEARKAQNFTVDDISKHLKIPEHTIAAIEANDLDALPAPTFSQGYIRAYAKFLEAQGEDEDGNLIPLLASGPVRPDLDGYFVTPAVWKAQKFDPQGAHQAQEIFGPDVVLYSTTCDPEAIKIANGTDYGLAMSVFTSDEERFEQMAWDLKAGVLNMTRAMAIDHGKDNIAINCVCPGDIDTPLLEIQSRQLGLDKEIFYREQNDGRPLKGPGMPEDVARAVFFFLSGLSRWITGSSLVVDGGGQA